MADSTITGLTSAGTVDGTEVLPIDQSGTTKKVTIGDLTPGLDEFIGDGGSPASAKGLVPAAASGDGAAGKFLDATGAWSVPVGGGAANATCNGRLTLTSGTAVTTTDVTSATTIYFTPYKGAQIGLYNGSSWDVISFSETSIALGTLTSGKNYDVFAYNNSGTLALEFSSAWTSDTARADALALQDGIYCKSGTLTRRYLGTFRTTSTTTTEDSKGGTTTQVGGKRFLWNCYNRVARSASVIDTTDSWTYTTTTIRQANGASGNKVEMVRGLAEDEISARLSALVTATAVAVVGIGLDSTSAFSGVAGGGYGTASGAAFSISAHYAGSPGIGYHYVAWLERGAASGSFSGDNGGIMQSGLIASVMA